MKNIIKTIAKSTLLVAISFGFALAAVNAWDETMTDDEILFYLNQEPDDKKLQKMALKRNLVCEDEIVEGKWIGGAPEFEPYDGHCCITDEYQKGEEIFNKAFEMWTSAEEAGCSVEFNECLNITKLMYESAE